MAVEGLPLIVAEGLRLGCHFHLSFSTYCFIVKPFETLIVIRGCNKLDLLWAPAGKERASSAKEAVSHEWRQRRSLDVYVSALSALF